MNTSTPVAPLEAGWKSYCKAVTFLLPAILLWQIACTWFFPKLQQIWHDAGATGSDAQWVMNSVRFLAQNGGLILLVAGVALVLMEWLARARPQARRDALWVIVFTLNTTVLFGLTFMCLAAVFAAPALAQAK